MRHTRKFIRSTALVLTAATLFTYSAFAADRTDPVPETGTVVTREVGEDMEFMSAQAYNEYRTYMFMTRTMGFNSAVTAGILANIKAESGFRADALGDGGTSYGICQWHNGRFTNLKNFCSEQGYDYTSIDGQLWFLKHELENGYASMLADFYAMSNEAQSAYDAGYQWCYSFERPANKASKSASRGSSAMNTYYPKWKYYTNLYYGYDYDVNLYPDIEVGSELDRYAESAISSGLMEDIDGKFLPGSVLTIGDAFCMAAGVHYLYTYGTIVNEEHTEEFIQTCADYLCEQQLISETMHEMDPNQLCHRDEFAEIMKYAMPWPGICQLNEVTLDDIPDIDEDSPSAEAVLKLYNGGILDLRKGNFEPDYIVNRGYAAMVLHRLLNYEARIVH